ncbi:hypothetical protein MPH47_06205 [Psychrobacillus psychrodurans]|uniref:hypothetical protein n=1 Tax=Psychrobacillus psychrodurans TaxID=126157 RepID=UPI001F4E9545|nr:hypothetical protein [Psychrobacillus psychrodurans]MCK1996823.1 hypothetical protein [Psychrobacillus psychrodurans]
MYEQVFQERVIQLKDQIKPLKKQLKNTTLASHETYRLNNKIEHFEGIIKRFNVKKLKLRELPNSMIVNMLVLDKFLVKLKRKFEYRLSVTEGGLLLEYWNLGRTHEKPTGRLTLIDLSEHYFNYDVPYLEDTYILGEIQ